MRRPLLALAFCGHLFACSFDSTVPPPVTILCSDNTECPMHYVCQRTLGRCVVAGSTDVIPPQLIDPVITPAAACKGTAVELTFTSNEDVFADPAVKLHPADGTEADFTAESPSPFRFGYTVTGSEAEGLAEVTVELIDRAGNDTGPLSAAVVRLDFTPPTVSAVQFVEPPIAPDALLDVRPGTQITYRLQMSEPVRPDGLVLRSFSAPPSGPMLVSTLDDDNNGLVDLSLTVPSNAAAGQYVLALDDIIDLAGNHAVRDASGHPAMVTLSLTVDDVAPDLTALTTTDCASQTPTTTFSQVSGHSCMRIAFSVSGTPSAVQVQAGPRAITACTLDACTPGAMGAFDCACQTTVLATDPEGPTAVVVTASDAAGNVRTASTPVTFDFTAPVLVPGTVSLLLQPDADCPLQALQALGAHGSARVGFVLNEPGPLPVIATQPGDLTVGTVTASPGSNGYSAQLRTGSGGLTDGAHTLNVTATDAVGNTATFALPVTLTVDSTPPAAPATGTPSRVVLRRIPWGATETLGAKALTLRGAAAATDGAGELIVYAGPVGSTLEVGRTATQTDGSFATFALGAADEPLVSVAFFDPACNVSPQALVHDIEWVSSIRGKVAGSILENPNRFVTQLVHFEGRQAADAHEKGATDGLVGDAGFPLVVTGAWDWRKRAFQAPSSNAQYGFAYDSDRARGVVFDGASGMFFGPEELSEWDGAGWAIIPPAFTPDGTPGQRVGPAMTYDSARQRTVLFGGVVPFGATDSLMEWDGVRWYAFSPSPRPGARQGGVMAFDKARSETVLFSGDGASDTWTWNGAQWTQKTSANVPSARSGHAMAYDSLRQRIVLFGGNDGALRNDTWEWDGSAWQQVMMASPPPARANHGLAFDVRRGTTLMLGGDGASGRLADLWEYNGSSWSQLFVTSPSVSQHAMFYEAARDRLVIFGGGSSTPASGPGIVIGSRETWGFDGAAWSRLSVPGTAPSARAGVALAFSASLGGAVMFGGRVGSTAQSDTWLLDETGWRQLSVGAPPARSGHAMQYDPVEGALIMAGGDNGAGALLADTYKLAGSGSWTPVGVPTFQARSGHGMGFDPDAGVMVLQGGSTSPGVVVDDTWTRRAGADWVLEGASGYARASFGFANDPLGGLIAFSGSTGNGTAGDTWRWRAGGWQDLGFLPSRPGFRAGQAMAYDPSAGKAVMFSGCGSCVDTDTWNGSVWAPAVIGDPTGDVLPPWRSSFGFAYDARRSRLVAFGGDGPSGQLGDTWELLTRTAVPSEVFSAALWSAAIPSGSTLNELDVRASGGASAQSAGAGVDGAALLPWIDGTWYLPAGGSGGTNSAATASPAALTWSTTNPGVLGALVLGQRELSVAVAPRGNNGTGFASVSATDVEVELKYRVP